MENNVTDIKNVCFLSFNVFISDVQVVSTKVEGSHFAVIKSRDNINFNNAFIIIIIMDWVWNMMVKD